VRRKNGSRLLDLGVITRQPSDRAGVRDSERVGMLAHQDIRDPKGEGIGKL
jgi:hypothetical protein